MQDCLVVEVGSIDYPAALALQRDLHHMVANDELPAVLLLLQHPHIYTLGRRGSDADILVSTADLKRLNADVYRTDRGGEVTYHGPGQLVGYPILNLRAAGLGPLAYVRALERIIISTLAELGVDSTAEDKPTGVWVDDAKIAAIGVRVSRGVTMHGFALNVNPDLSYFKHIVPCGLTDANVTSIADLGVSAMMGNVTEILTAAFARTLAFSPRPTTLESLPANAQAIGTTAQTRL